MRTLAQRILVAFMTCWLPFCCCQARVAANVLMHLSHAEEVDCCSPECCGSDAATGHGGCCDGGGDGKGTDEGPKGSCCVACKERALPPASPSTLDEASASAIDFVATALLAEAAVAGRDVCASVHARFGSGPPPRPSGRLALCVHSVLVI